MILALALSLSLNAAPAPAFTQQVDAHLKAAFAHKPAQAPARPVQREGRTPRPAAR